MIRLTVLPCGQNITRSCFWKALLELNCKAKVVWVTNMSNMGCWGGGRLSPAPLDPRLIVIIKDVLSLGLVIIKDFLSLTIIKEQ